MIRCPRQLDGQIDHLLAINTVRIELAVGLPPAGGELVWWRSDWELRAHSRARTIPDALFAVHWPGIDEQVFALEVEYGTRAPRSFQAKLLRYATAGYRRGIYGETDPIVLVVGRDPSVLARYRTALAPLALRVTAGFADLGQIETCGAVGPVWRSQHGEECLSLRGLANCCYRENRLTAETRGESRPCAAGAAHIYPHLAVR